MSQFLFQVINFLLHGLVAILPLRYVTSHSRVASARLGSVHTTLSISFILLILFILRVRKIILSLRLRTPLDTDLLGVDLNPPCPIVALTGTQVLPKDGANCRDTNCGPCLIGMGDWPSAPCTMNL